MGQCGYRVEAGRLLEGGRSPCHNFAAVPLPFRIAYCRLASLAALSRLAPAAEWPPGSERLPRRTWHRAGDWKFRSWFWDRFQRAFFHLFLYPSLNLHNRAQAIFSFGRDLVWPSLSKFGWSSGENPTAAQRSYARMLSCP